MIQINVDGSVVSVQETEALYAGAKDVHICSFRFDRSWEKYLKSAVFRVNGRAITQVVDENDACVLPWELLVRDNIGCSVEVGVYGVSADEEILTSVWDRIGAVREGTELGSDAREPSAGVYEQLAVSVQKVDNKITGYSAEVQTLVQRAESAAEIAQAGIREAVVSAGAAAAAKSALKGVQDALDSIPEGSTIVINDLTTGGAGAALSAEMGKVLARRPNPNLLHNGYFANCVNQRGKTEYTERGYTLDCWQKAAAGTVMVADGYVTLSAEITLMDKPEQEIISAITGVPTTFSALTDTGLLSGTVVFAGDGAIYHNGSDIKLRISGGGNPYITTTEEVRLLAVKLELGSEQTLAHWDGEKWVLNEIPDYGEELWKCQRYYQLFSGADKRPTEAVDYRPTMRTTPKTGEIEIDGVTYYYADANL